MAAKGLGPPLNDSMDKSKNSLDKVRESAATYRWASKPNQRSTPAQMIFSQISGLSLELLHRSGYHKRPFVSPRLHVSPCNLSWENSILWLPKWNYFPAPHRLPGCLKCVQHCRPWDIETWRCVKLKGRWSRPQVHTALDLTAGFSLRPKQQR